MRKRYSFRYFVGLIVTLSFTLGSCNMDNRAAVIDPAPYLALVNDADWSFFDDAVFIGDSVSLKLRNYVIEQRKTDPGFLGSAQFLTSGSLGSGNALWEVSDESVHPAFQGVKMRLEDSIPLTKAKKVFIMLGINDLNVYAIDGAIDNYTTLLELIQAAVPDVEFYIQSATPIYEGHERNAMNNENLKIYNQKLLELCQKKGYHYIEVAEALRDNSGYLASEYCSDPDIMGIHMTDLASRVWLGYLLFTLNKTEDINSLQEAMGAMTQSFPIDDPIMLDETDLLDFYGISADNVKQFSAQICSSGVSTQEIILIEAVDENNAAIIEGNLQNHLNNQIAATRYYLPDEYAILSQCKVRRDGVYVALIADKNYEVLEQIYEDHVLSP